MFILADSGSAFSFGKTNELKAFEYMFAASQPLTSSAKENSVLFTYII